MKTKLFLTFSLLALLAMTLAYGQTLGVTAKIPFAFIASGKTLPAGQYAFVPEAEVMRVVGTGKSAAIIVPIITRLGGAVHTSKQDSHVVFDEVGGICTLSEVWVPGEDGWLMFTTKGKHQHKTVDVPR